MTYMDEDEAAGIDIWDKMNRPRRKQIGIPVVPAPYNVEGARASTQPREPVRYPADRPGAPPPPVRPPDQGRHRWDMDRRVPPQWQREGDPSRGWTGSDTTDAYRAAGPRERAAMQRAAYQAGRNGDTGAAESFPPGSPERAAYERGARERAAASRQVQR